ncbi:MAG: hypothetical protein ACFFE4_10285 [Candidatus Thorarchaeota archaeon]
MTIDNSNEIFANVIEILEQIIDIIEQKDPDLTWSRFDNIDDIIDELRDHIKNLKNRNLSKLNDLILLFAPTASLQEISISSGWGSKFLKISKKFDLTIEELKHEFNQYTKI